MVGCRNRTSGFSRTPAFPFYADELLAAADDDVVQHFPGGAQLIGYLRVRNAGGGIPGRMIMQYHLLRRVLPDSRLEDLGSADGGTAHIADIQGENPQRLIFGVEPDGFQVFLFKTAISARSRLAAAFGRGDDGPVLG